MEFLVLFAYFQLSILTFYIVGTLLFYSFELEKTNLKKDYSFKKIVFGILFTVLIGSMYFTSFKTVNSLILIPIFTLIIIYRKKIKLKNPYYNTIQSLKSLSFFRLAIKSIPFYLFNALFFFDFHENSNYLDHHPDFIHYATYSQSLILSGNENYFRESNSIFPSFFNGLTPYHYFELWLNTFLGTLLKLSYIKSLLLITYPLFQFTSFLGLYHFFKRKNFLNYVLCFLLLFTQPIFFNFFNNFELLKYNTGICFTSILGFSAKYSVLYMFAILALVYFYENKKKTAFIIFISLPLLSIGLLPGIIGGNFVYILILMFSNKYIKVSLKGILYILTISISILFLYKTFSISFTKDLISDNNIISLLVKERGLNIPILKNMIFKMVFPLFRVLLFILPYIVILLFFLRDQTNKFKSLIYFITFILLSATFGSAIAYNLPDSGQLLYNCIPLLNIVNILVIINFFNKNSKHLIFFKYIIFILLVYNMINSTFFLNKMNKKYTNIYSPSFTQDCLTHLHKNLHQNEIIGYFNNGTEKFNPHKELYRSPIIPFVYSDKNPIFVCLNNPFQYEKDTLYNKTYHYMQPLYVFSTQHIKLTYDQLIRKFISQYGVQFIFAKNDKNNNIYNLLEPIISDKKSNYTLYRLKTKCSPSIPIAN